ncbi:hypothetical protein CLF_101633 [Clonorchis sinensis]|uniref:Uncharacterized protein n=1 Tax=Clonorchis sinensis TaxID=79923 RepID=G7Y669_CLOSI|nr:hypothetical protein CLF_101633 [Clonorchis sinensis]
MESLTAAAETRDSRTCGTTGAASAVERVTKKNAAETTLGARTNIDPIKGRRQGYIRYIQNEITRSTTVCNETAADGCNTFTGTPHPEDFVVATVTANRNIRDAAAIQFLASGTGSPLTSVHVGESCRRPATFYRGPNPPGYSPKFMRIIPLLSGKSRKEGRQKPQGRTDLRQHLHESSQLSSNQRSVKQPSQGDGVRRPATSNNRIARQLDGLVTCGPQTKRRHALIGQNASQWENADGLFLRRCRMSLNSTFLFFRARPRMVACFRMFHWRISDLQRFRILRNASSSSVSPVVNFLKNSCDLFSRRRRILLGSLRLIRLRAGFLGTNIASAS